MARSNLTRHFVLATLVSLLGLDLRSAEACSCRPPPTAEVALSGSDAVFEARVVSVSAPPASGIGSTGTPVTVKLAVLRAWKGADIDAGRDVTISTPSGGATCGFGFQPNETYLVYAVRADGGTLATNICMRTKRSADAAADITALTAAAASPTPAQTTPTSAPTSTPTSAPAADVPPFEANPGVPAVVSSAPPPPPPGPKPVPKAGANAGCALSPSDLEASAGAGALTALGLALAAAALRRPRKPN